MLRFLARKYEFRDEEERAPLEAVINATFPILLHIFQVGAGLGGWLADGKVVGWRDRGDEACSSVLLNVAECGASSPCFT